MLNLTIPCVSPSSVVESASHLGVGGTFNGWIISHARRHFRGAMTASDRFDHGGVSPDAAIVRSHDVAAPRRASDGDGGLERESGDANEAPVDDEVDNEVFDEQLLEYDYMQVESASRRAATSSPASRPGCRSGNVERVSAAA